MSTPSAQFVALLEKMSADSLQQADYLDGLDINCWMLPPEAGWSGDLKDPSQLKLPFTDASLDADYLASHTSYAGVGVTMGQEQQMSYYKMMQRSFYGRHMTPARARTIVAGRYLAHSEGTHQDVIDHVEQVMDAGVLPSPSP